MSLTGIPLIVVAVLATLLVAAGTVLTWRRGGRLRVALRSAGLLLTEVTLLLSVGLVVNRSEQFYPSWAALSQSARTSGTTFAVTPGKLDDWLRANGPAFHWQPGGWNRWHLAGAPTVVVPGGYLDHPKWRYSALVVVDDGSAGWTPAIETTAARDASADGGAVVIFARTTATTRPEALARELPVALGHDLRVTARRWALISGPSDAALARRVVLAAPGRYPAIAVVPGSVAKPGRRLPPPGPRLPAGIVVAAPADFRTGTTGAVNVSAALPTAPSPGIKLRAALLWACQQTPPPLAASAPSVVSLPVAPKKKTKHHKPRPASTWKPPGTPSSFPPGPARSPYRRN